MPEHFHLLISEPDRGTPSTVMQVLKQRFARRVHGLMKTTPQVWLSDPDEAGQIWQERFYDFNVWTEKKQIEKLRYIHRNPVERGPVAEPDQWRWSSFRSYAYREPGLVRNNV